MTTQYRIVERTFSLVGGGERKTWYPQYKLAWWPIWWNFNNHRIRPYRLQKFRRCENDCVRACPNGTIDRVVKNRKVHWCERLWADNEALNRAGYTTACAVPKGCLLTWWPKPSHVRWGYERHDKDNTAIQM